MAKKLIVEVVGDTKSYERALNRSATATSQFGQAVGTTSPRIGKLQGTMAATGFSAVGLAGAAAGLAVVIGGKSVQAASDLNEEITKSQQIFGESAKEIRDWSETTAQAMGISQTEALRATGTFGALFKTLGFGNTQNAKLSKSLVQLASDMASFNNADPTDVLISIRSGLVGEAEPLRRYGVFLSEARVQQVALAQTGKKTITTLTNQEKAFARYSIILKDTASAQGDFARTSGSLANQQRVLAAQVANLETKIGTVLLPSLTELVTTFNEVIGVSDSVLTALGKLRDFGPIDIPVSIAVQLSFAGRGVGGFKGFINKAKQETADAVAAGLSAGLGPIKSLEDIFSGKGGHGFTFFPSPVDTKGGGTGDDTKGAGKKPPKTKPPIDPKVGAAIITQITKQAAAQSNLNLQLANSEKRAEHLRDLIRQDPNNAKLQQRLTAELSKQSTLRGQIAQKAQDATDAAVAEAKAARDTLLSTLDLVAAQAGLTKSLQDDLVAAKARESTLRRLVKLNRDDLDLANQLVSATQARRDLEKEIADNKRDARNAAAFKALGLTAEGLTPTPSSGALLKRATGLQDQIKGTVLDTKKTRNQLKKIVAYLKANLKGAGKEVRDAVLSMLNEISGAFDQDKKTGPLTKTHGLNTKKIAEGLGLSPEQERELRGRLSHFNTAGRALGGGSTNAPGGSSGGFSPGGDGRIVVESHTRIDLDGKTVANVVTRQQQKDRRRNPRQKRGQHRN